MTETVAIIGAGLIGRAWASIFARAGWNVRVTDPDANARVVAKELILEELRGLARHGLASDPEGIIHRVTVCDSNAETVKGATFVQENGPEVLEIKQALFKELDQLLPKDVVISSSTSAIVTSRFTEDLPGRARCMVGHPVNPPHLVPLVELSGAPWTSAETLERARKVYLAIGQVPIDVKKEIDGFILNRLQGALLAEAFRLVGEGYVSAEDVDHCVKNGLGTRWSFMGPFETIELNAPGGVPDYCARYTGFYKRLASQAAGPAVYEGDNLKNVVNAWRYEATPERIARRTRERNERLAALAAHKKSQPELS
ncbi:3-hydroxyacyl-CoA dehydrogenase [Rhizobiales bacterium TNE-4]|nr:3-hydroxyacyl-CoA dehydrogenase [Rhizobiales bacterium TNE-4]MBV1827691.1 3-hydroxyacyl-CoA dehydrogenase [Rhizobiales bacterium TNE-4]